jgi:glycosylphosphatidylinositol deacylase
MLTRALSSDLLLNGAKIAAFPSSPSLVSEIWLPALDTSLLSLKLHVYRSSCQGR